jgi:hypothetical protein
MKRNVRLVAAVEVKLSIFEVNYGCSYLNSGSSGQDIGAKGSKHGVKLWRKRRVMCRQIRLPFARAPDKTSQQLPPLTDFHVRERGYFVPSKVEPTNIIQQMILTPFLAASITWDTVLSYHR